MATRSISGEKQYSYIWKEMVLGESKKILKASHVSVINWVKKAGAKLEEGPKKDEKVEIFGAR